MCKAEYSISAMWFRLDFIMTLLSLGMPFLDGHLARTRQQFNLEYTCLYLHTAHHKS